MVEVAGEFIEPNDRLTSFERLEIYNRQYWFRLQSALQEDFPALRAVVGAKRFETLRDAYLAVNPSRSFTLRNLGSNLLEWLTVNPEYAGRRIRLALDVVRVEWACVEAFDNAEFPPLNLEQVSRLGAESRLALQPHVRLLALEYPADDLVLDMHRHQRRESSEAGTRPAAEEEQEYTPLQLRKWPTRLAIHRSEFSIYYKRLSRMEYLTLTALRDGSTLPDALAAGFAESQLSVASQIRLVQRWFADWAELGWLYEPTR
jgi:hypothetical protein